MGDSPEKKNDLIQCQNRFDSIHYSSELTVLVKWTVAELISLVKL